MKLKDPSNRQLIAIGKITQYYEKEYINFLYFTLKITKPIHTKYTEVKECRGVRAIYNLITGWGLCAVFQMGHEYQSIASEK